MSDESRRKSIIWNEITSMSTDIAALKWRFYNEDHLDPTILKRIAKSARTIAETLTEAQGESS